MKRQTNTWRGLMLHHTATSQGCTVDDITAMHQHRGFETVGYHYLIKIKGDTLNIKNGRSTNYVGAHCDAGGYNSTHIGVALIGNFEKDSLNSAQYKALINCIRHIMQKHNLTEFKGHREAKATACPGKNINLNQLRKDLNL